MGIISVLLMISLSISSASAMTTQMNGMPHMTKLCFGKPSKNSDWSNCDMRYMDLTNLDLSGINLSGANLQGMRLYDVNFAGANLEGANVAGLNTASADLSCYSNSICQ